MEDVWVIIILLEFMPPALKTRCWQYQMHALQLYFLVFLLVGLCQRLRRDDDIGDVPGRDCCFDRRHV